MGCAVLGCNESRIKDEVTGSDLCSLHCAEYKAVGPTASMNLFVRMTNTRNSPEGALLHLRALADTLMQHVKYGYQPPADSVREFALSFQALDQVLSNKGELPPAWSNESTEGGE